MMKDMKELRVQIEELKEYEAMKKELEGMIENLKDSIKAEMVAEDKTEMQVGPFRVTYNDVVSQRVDTKKLAEMYPAIYSSMSKESSYKRLMIY